MVNTIVFDADPAIVRAVLNKMRAPSDRMIEAMVITPLPSIEDNRPLWKAIWQRGIDTALEEFGG